MFGQVCIIYLQYHRIYIESVTNFFTEIKKTLNIFQEIFLIFFDSNSSTVNEHENK